MSRVVDVSVIVVSYNTREETLACLESVYAQAGVASFELIVVDNASRDGSAEAITERFPGAKLIASDANLGFARANNVAAEHAVGKYLLLLNPDTVILNGAIDRIVQFAADHPDAQVYGGRTLFGDRSLNRNSCHGEPTPWSLFCMGFGLSSLFRRSQFFNPEGLGNWQRDSVREVACVTGCFLLIERDLWERLGGFDTTFFMYGEDTDLCMRARKAGARCLICSDAELIHYGGRSEKIRGDKMVRLFTAKHQLFQKHWPQALVPWGDAMLSMWALSRWAVHRSLAVVNSKYRSSAGEWRSVFLRRSDFCRRSSAPASQSKTHPVGATGVNGK